MSENARDERPIGTYPTPESSATVLELYKTAVEMADRVSARRGVANAFFLSVQTAFIAAVGLAGVGRPPGRWWTALALALAGISLSAAWWLQLRSYRELNRAKFTVINTIEASLPAQVFTDEWAILTAGSAGHSRSRYRELGFSERLIPWIFALLHLVLLTGTLLS